MTALQLVSIVMPSLNQVGFIVAAIESVLQQDYPNLELIVADGGSEDGTVDLLVEWQARDARLKWFSRKDTGPANALNNALNQVRGTLIGWLNSDDVYAPGAVRRAVELFESTPQWLMVYGHGQHINAESEPLGIYPTLPPTTDIQQFSYGCFICQPTVFFRRTIFVLLGKLDECLKTAFDFEYWLRAFLAFPKRIGFVDAVQAYSRLHESCITQRMRRTVALEGMQVLARHLGKAPYHWLLTYVDELLAQYLLDNGGIDLITHIELTIQEASPSLSVSDQRLLRELFESDKRILFAKTGFFISESMGSD